MVTGIIGAIGMGDFDSFRRRGAFNFMPQYTSLREVLVDHNLAALGDALVNFLYSLARSIKEGTPLGVKVKGRLLADALDGVGLRQYLPPRTTRHERADAAESLIFYAWARGVVTLEEEIEILCQKDDATEAFRDLLHRILSSLPLIK